MRTVLRRFLLVLALVPTFALADVASDMDANLPLGQVVAYALAANMTIGDIVDAMINHDPARADEIVRAAMAIAPADYQQIVAAAVNAGAPPGEVVSAAISASAGSDITPDAIAQAVLDAAPASEGANIVRAAGVATEAIGGQMNESRLYQSAVARAVKTKQIITSGGGSGNAVSQFSEVLQAIVDIETALTEAGLDPDRVSGSLTDLIAAARAEEIATAIEYLNALKDQITSGTITTLDQVTAGIDDTIASFAGGPPTS